MYTLAKARKHSGINTYELSRKILHAKLVLLTAVISYLIFSSEIAWCL